MGVGSGLGGVVLVVCLWLGLCWKSSALVLPHLVGQIVAICLMTTLGALVLLAHFVGKKIS